MTNSFAKANSIATEKFFATASFFATCAPGLEPLVAKELGCETFEEGGVSFKGGLDALYHANLHLHCASRVLVRLGSFMAKGFDELRKKAERLEWERFIFPGQPLSLHITCHKSRLYHSGAVAERLLAAIGERLGRPSVQVKIEDEEAAGGAQLVVVRLVHDQCTVSIDSSGALLHRRGYRLETAKAPLRETLAAGILLASGWDQVSTLLDPFCGSGTIAIEAARLARGDAPGAQRPFAFMNWPGYAAGKWQMLLQAAQAARKDPAGLPRIHASDRDAGAVRVAQENAERAGVKELIEFECQAVSAITPPPGPGWVVTNPPYGLRVSQGKDLRNLYAQLGHVLRRSCPGWNCAILCSDPALLNQVQLKLDTSFTTVNGGVRVTLGRGLV